MKRRVVVEAPASSANLGSGFDVFAVALRQPKDGLTLKRAPNGFSITVRGVGGVSEAPEKNVAGAVARAVMADWGGQGRSLDAPPQGGARRSRPREQRGVVSRSLSARPPEREIYA
ncbi:MAG: hypothetical protein LYZ69_08380 [Nitrososphaerales archaeon]|nr:hypothetical protein [Nitrososphaerales archaeon]